MEALLYERAAEALEGASDLRIYAVWNIRGRTALPSFYGIHYSLGLTAYAGLLRLAEGVFLHLQWRRCVSVAEAIALYRENVDDEGGRVGLDFFFWQ